ncbi:hypothetical protein [Arcanobacterium urinimassiliense]|nr:hypothetical protein [Arcanobacterium urinimassiliense]
MWELHRWERTRWDLGRWDGIDENGIVGVDGIWVWNITAWAE